ncbi:hypothetical protein A2715_03240 [Candidatus Woesebacteria bacterium RIFCSPHIGHO2_01_FULL_39_32]|uniref:Uncharacterized protein n=2 Tax=Candidatus Woeseibacteriota TaxID=1752722 RepID=A0A0G0SSP9_9BACT|nr:MAG: hypothetical protein UT61_C0046G0007 [Candidatus Woesebacteria bacterium GW2011_GWA1_39_8]OGM04361.1 MAG: hypothetical protein A2124_02810 [Candidatus Woesebacteria bacterium GWB1_37_5]OGM24753.1 MAG: hypothetical protein A2715_03240 [Candidatus Woesebacteria bacterium RIFCSPHIGHO2_01_FULL_39_32]OGM35703.1 MAG: hypothetical protein A3F01_06055 [Candidatus Woesebacteria bacterium RIFCSPHIGHO2_12_FULL_38_11]OGM64579.1 MAG: hypothetical protein A2893_06155 [Candidatus Woesebacteria bacteri
MIKASAHPTLENFTFKGATDKRFLNGFYRYIRSKVITDLHIFIPPQQFQNTVEDIKKALYLFGIDLGYDLTPRILFLNRLVFAKKADLLKKDSTWKDDYRSVFSQDNFKIYISVDATGSFRTNDSLAHSINHEFIHGISYKEIYISQNNKEWIVTKLGIRRKNRFFILNEAVTELTNIYVINKFWPRFKNTKSLVNFANREISAPNAVFLVNAMFEELVKRSHLSYKDILRKAQVDLLTGSQNTLSLISRFLGKDFIEVLSSSEESKKYDVIFNLNFLVEKSRRLKLVYFEKQLNNYKLSSDVKDILDPTRLL